MTEFEMGRRLVSRIVKVQRSGDGKCWEWTGHTIKRGYGAIKVNNRSWTVHRLAYHLFVGNIPEGLHVCHDCDNPPCCNPDHLFVGTNQDNVDDKVRKGRQAREGGRPRKDLSPGPIEGTRLTVLSPAGLKGRDAASLVRCSCGVEKVMRNGELKSGRIKSCGCYAREQASERVKKAPPRLGTGKRQPETPTKGKHE